MVRPHSAPHLTLDRFQSHLIFEWYLYNLLRKVEFHWNLKRITGTLHAGLCTFKIISCSVLLRMRSVSDKIVEKIKSDILCSITFSRKLCRLGDNVEQCCRLSEPTYDNLTWRMHFASWITKSYRYTLSVFNTYCFSTATMVTWTRVSVCYTYIACLLMLMCSKKHIPLLREIWS